MGDGLPTERSRTESGGGRAPAICLKPLPDWPTLTVVIALVEQHKAALAELCRQFRVERLDLFGSAARGTFHPEASDMDFLVTFADTQPGTYADRYLGLLLALQKLFQRDIDLVTERSIRNPYFRKAVNATRQVVYDGRGEKAVA